MTRLTFTIIPTDGSLGKPLEDCSTWRPGGTAVWVNTAMAWPERTIAVSPATLPLAYAMRYLRPTRARFDVAA